MNMEMSRTQRVLCLLSIMLTNIAIMADLVIIPIISNLYKAFPDQTFVVNFIVSGPMLIIVGSSLLATLLLKKFSKKTVIITGSLIFAIGSILIVMQHDAVYIAVMRTLLGIGTGFVNVTALSLIADIYENENTRAKIIGYYNASMSFIAIIFSYFSGIIAETDWQNSFKLYWLSVPMVIMLILFVPNIRKDSLAKERPAKDALGWRYWSLAAIWLIMNILFSATVLYYISPYIVENSLGDSAFTGIATSIKQTAGFLISLGFAFIYTKLRRQTNTIACLVAAAGILIMILAPSKFSVVVVAVIVGCAYKIAFTYVYVRGFEIVPKSRFEDAVAITTAVYGIGSFLSTYFVTWLMKIMKTDLVTPTWRVAVALFVLLALAEIISAFKEKKEFGVGILQNGDV